MDPDDLLREALSQESIRQRAKRRRRKDSINQSASEDYALRLAEKALYRRLISESHIAQDGLRFAFYFSDREGHSIDWWRNRIDKEMNRARYPNAYRDIVLDSLSRSKARSVEPRVGEENSDEG